MGLVRLASGKSASLLTALTLIGGCTADIEQAGKPSGVMVPELGVEHVYHCDDTKGWEREQVRVFTMMNDGRLKVEVSEGGRVVRVEKSAADLGIWAYDVLDYGNVIWRSEHEIEGLEDIRQLVPKAQANGHIDYSKGDSWIREAISVTVVPASRLQHRTLGEIEVLRIESRRWKWNDKYRRWSRLEQKFVGRLEPKDIRNMISYIDSQSRRIVRYIYTEPETTTACDWTGTR